MDTYSFTDMFDWDVIPGTTYDEKFHYVSSIRDDAFNEQIDTVEYNMIIVGRDGTITVNTEHDPAMRHNKILTSILTRAVATKSAAFVYYLMENIIWPFLDGVGLEPYLNSFRSPFIDAIMDHNHEMLEVLFGYYDPRFDPFFGDEVFHKVVSTDDPRSYYLLLCYYDLSTGLPPYGYWDIVSKGSFEIAEDVRRHLIMTGHPDPIKDSDKFKDTWTTSLQNKCTPIVEYLKFFIDQYDLFRVS